MRTFTTMMVVAWGIGAVLAFCSREWVLGGSFVSAMFTTMIVADNDDDRDDEDELDEAA